MFNLETATYGYTDQELTRGAVHGIHVGKIDHGCLVAEVFERGVSEVEVNAFHQHVGGAEQAAGIGGIGGVTHHGTVVAHTHEGGIVNGLEVGREVVNESEFA